MAEKNDRFILFRFGFFLVCVIVSSACSKSKPRNAYDENEKDQETLTETMDSSDNSDSVDSSNNSDSTDSSDNADAMDSFDNGDSMDSSSDPSDKGDKESPTDDRLKSNLQVEKEGNWVGISCSGSRASVGTDTAEWIEHHRYLVDLEHKRILDCPERRLRECDCNDLPNDLFNNLIDDRRSVKDRDLRPYGEAFHGHPDGPVSSSIDRADGDGVFPDIGRANCVFVTRNDELSVQPTNGKKTTSGQWPDNNNCNYFKLN
ncbi:MAG: hypothetical protein AB8G05_13400 [Oligoflexales bacterium]